MNLRVSICTVVTSFLSILCTVSFASDPLPIVLIHDNATISPKQADSLLQQLSSQTIRSSVDNRSDQILTYSIDQLTMGKIRRLYQQAQDQYYNGDFQTAEQQFIRVQRTIHKHIPSITFEMELRQIDREISIFLAMVAKEMNDEFATDTYLATASQRYPDMTKENSLFPPWIRSALKKNRQKNPVQLHQVSLSTTKHCTTEIDGAPISDSHARLSSGPHTFRQICNNNRERSLTSILHVDKAVKTWEPFYLKGVDLHFTQYALSLRSSTAKSTDEYATFLQRLAKRMKWEKFIVIHFQKHNKKPKISIFLVGSNAKIIHSHIVSVSEFSAQNIRSTLQTILTTRPPLRAGEFAPPVDKKKWFKKPTAWIVTAGGVGLLATGLMLGNHYGSPSPEEPAIWALQLIGGAMATTGIALFILPSFTRSPDISSVGIQAGWNF